MVKIPAFVGIFIFQSLRIIKSQFLFLSMKLTYLFLILLLAACNQTIKSSNGETLDTTIVVSNDTIPEIRKSVKEAPVADYSENIPDELNEWKFEVSAFETKKTFQYLLRMKCKEVRVTDSLKIPNFGIQPKVVIKKGNEPLSCIIGFLDKKGEFKEYKKVNFKEEQLHIKTIKSYYVGAYKTKVQ